MYKLIERCLAGEQAAWSELWDLYYHHAAHPTQRLLVRAGFNTGEADDIAVQVFTSLYNDGGKRLRSFHGDSQADWIRWLVRVAINATRNWIKRGWRAKKRERIRRKRFVAPDRQTATPAEVASLLEELQSVLSHDDVNRLRHIAGLGSEPHESAVSGRTERRRRHDLEQKLNKHLGLRGRQKPKRGKKKRKKT